MVYTLTCNPSVEYVMEVAEFMPGIRNRSQRAQVYPGGKGIHVSKALRRLGVQSVALGFIGGFTGDYIEHDLQKQGCGTKFIRLEEGFSCIHVKIKGGEEAEILGTGPKIPQEALDALLAQVEGLQSGDLLILSGELPAAVPRDFYEKVLERAVGHGVYTIADVSGETLLRLLRRKPFLVKPNRQELEEFAGRRLFTRDEIFEEGRRMQEMGAENVLISIAAEGAVLFSGDDVLYGEAPRGEAFHPDGAGDAMLAGFAAGWLQTGSFREALRLGIAAGSASVLCRGEATGEEMRQLYDENIICRIRAEERRKLVL